MQCVYSARDVGEADIVAAWLVEQGIPVFVKDRLTATALWPMLVAPRGIQVCAEASADVERARQLLEQHRRTLASKRPGGERESETESE